MSAKRYIALSLEGPPQSKSWPKIRQDISSALTKEVKRVHEHARQSYARHDTIYTGVSGIAFMNYHLAVLREKFPCMDALPDALTLIREGDVMISTVLQNYPLSRSSIPDAAHASFIETPVGLATLSLARSSLMTNKEDTKATSLLEHAIALATEGKSSDSDDGCEVLYGRAGLLYALLYLRQCIVNRVASSADEAPVIDGVGKLTSDENILIILKSILSKGRCGAAFYREDHEGIPCPPLMWSWHGKRYLGGAHGVAGILQIVLHVPLRLLSEEYIDDILGTVEWLLLYQDGAGNWAPKAPRDGELGVSEIVQWCHGAPAMIILFSTVLRMARSGTLSISKTLEQKLWSSLESASSLIYRHGLLRKGLGLCHGVSGSIFALLAASDILDIGDNQGYFSAAAHLAQLATSHEEYQSSGQMRVPDHPWSLYEGMAGMCCAWSEILSRLGDPSARECSGMPAFDDIEKVQTA